MLNYFIKTNRCTTIRAKYSDVLLHVFSITCKKLSCAFRIVGFLDFVHVWYSNTREHSVLKT
jgi:hypothetical protein